MTLIRGGLIGAVGGGTGSTSTQLALSDGLACYATSFSGITTSSFSHNLGTEDLVVEFRDVNGNLLVPTNWQVINSNVLDVEFSSPTQGSVTIIGCIESGLAPITGGVTSVEGLSGIIDLDSPNNSILITTSGQVIQLNAIFTPGSGAILEQHSRDLVTLSGLIGAGGGGGGVTSLQGISGVITLDSPNDTISIGVNGQVIEIDSIFTWASGQLVESLVTGSGVRAINGVSGLVGLVSTNNGLVVNTNGQVIELTSLFTYTSGQIIDQHGVDIATLSGLANSIVSDAGQTSINGLSGQLQLTSPDNSILIGDNDQAIELSGLFTPASGVRVNQLIHERKWHGVVSGLEISINTSNSGLFDLAAGVAYVSGIRIEVAAQSGIDPQFPPTSGSRPYYDAYIGLNLAGNVFTRIDGILDYETLETSIDLGVLRSYSVGSANSGLIEHIHSERYEILRRDHHASSWLQFAVGAVIASGVLVTDNGSLTLAVSEGVFFDRHQNRHTHSLDNPLEFYEIYRDGAGNYGVQGGLTTTVRNTEYDGGFGLVPMVGNRFAMHSLWFDVVDDEHYLVISNAEYTSLQLAQDAPINPGSILDRTNIIPTAKIIIQRNQTVFGGTTGRIVDVRPILGARSDVGVLATTATTLQQAYDNSSTVEIVLDLERDGLNILDTAANELVAGGNALLKVSDGANTTRYFGVTGSGISIPSGAVAHRLGIGLLEGEAPRCSLDVSGLICASGLEIIGSRPTLSGIGLATLADLVDTEMSLNGLSGAVVLTSPDNSININLNGQNIELVTNISSSGGCSVHNFTPADGTLFTVTHGLNTEDFVWSLWRTDASPHTSTIANVAPSGANHAVVELSVAISGKLVLHGCATSGVRTDVIATKEVSSHYTTSPLDELLLVDASSSSVTVTTFNPSGYNGRSLYVKKTDSSSNVVTLNSNGSGLIDGANSLIINTPYDAVRISAHNGNWWIL